MLHRLIVCMLIASTTHTFEHFFTPFTEIDTLDLSRANFYIPQEKIIAEKAYALFYNIQGFFVIYDEKISHIDWCNTDAVFYERSVHDIVKYSTLHAFRITKDAGNYTVATSSQKKRGVFGAWLGSTLGYGLVTFVGQGTIYGISLLAGRAQPIALATLEKMYAIPIHSAACSAGIACGILGATATGPL